MSKKSSKFFICLYAILILSFSVLLFAIPKNEFSPTENRMLSDFPKLSADSVIDGSFMKKFSSFCCDHFPLRNTLLAIDSSSELALGKLEADSVMIGKNNNLIKRLEYNDFSTLRHNLEAIENLRSFANENTANFVFFCAPRSVDVLTDFCPFPFEGGRCGNIWNEIGSAVTVTNLLSQKATSGEYVFYKTDHHWTTLGAYYAYSVLGRYLGYTPFPLSDFRIEEASDCFYGSTYASAIILGASPDSIFAMRYEGDEKITVTDSSTKKVGGLYDYSALKGSSKYDFFLGGNKARLRIENGDKPTLILIKDSFANSIAPFLSRHYNIELIDPRYLREPLESLLSNLYRGKEKPPLLILAGIDTLASTSFFRNSKTTG